MKRLLIRAVWCRFAASLALVALGVLWLALFHPANFLSGVQPVLPAALILSEGCLRLLRDNGLESLGAQASTQLGVLLRTCLVLAGAFVLQLNGVRFDTNLVLGLELVASCVVLGYAIWAVRRALHRLTVSDVPVGDPGWVGEPFAVSFRKGWHNYLSALISYPLSMQALVLLVSVSSTPAALASFGFIARLFEIMRGYVPALMLMSVLRPRFIGLYALSQDFGRLAREALLASRLSGITVAPLVGIVCVWGDLLMQWLSGGRVNEGRWILGALVASLMLRVHRQISVVIVNCVGRSEALTRLSLLGLLGWLLALVFAWQGAASWGVVLAVLWDEAVWVAGSASVLRNSGHEWPTELPYVGGLTALSLLAGLGIFLMPLPASPTGVLAGCCLLAIVFFILLVATRMVSLTELRGVKSLILSNKS